jgi:hypothetical protein
MVCNMGVGRELKHSGAASVSDVSIVELEARIVGH